MPELPSLVVGLALLFALIGLMQGGFKEALGLVFLLDEIGVGLRLVTPRAGTGRAELFGFGNAGDVIRHAPFFGG